MSRGVFDSSVLLAIAKEEPLSRDVLDLLPSAVISSVNVAEVLSKLTELGLRQQANLTRLLGFLDGIAPFTQQQAITVGRLRALTSHAGLSLGDRACLALALELGVPAYTTDKNWLRVEVGCQIICLR